jgi:sterol desaturase/sphingolipid hydroxylase (fatty acid hydroxylase superfamily)
MLSNFLPSGAPWIPLTAFGVPLLLLAAAEMWRPLHVGREEPKGRIGGNVAMGVINAGLGALLPVSTVIAAGWAARHDVGLMNEVALPALAIVAATVAIRNLATYAVHRLSHAVPFLWRVHRVHHADIRLDLSTGFRNHPLELAIGAPLLAGVTIACGLDAATLAVYESVAIVFAMWSHANLRLPERLDRRLRLALVTPAMHHVHHSSRRRETDSNYGDVLSLWDRLFGTYVDLTPGQLRATRFGLGDAHDEGAPHLLHQLRSPFARERRAPVPSEA